MLSRNPAVASTSTWYDIDCDYFTLPSLPLFSLWLHNIKDSTSKRVQESCLACFTHKRFNRFTWLLIRFEESKPALNSSEIVRLDFSISLQTFTQLHLSFTSSCLHFHQPSSPSKFFIPGSTYIFHPRDSLYT
jgi:hypothetical protein